MKKLLGILVLGFVLTGCATSIDSPFGHCAANPGNDKNFELQLDKNVSELLN